ncbi:hypothetical protein ACSLVQ_27980, partial [Klebsiella pneumoniae]|uniref:hypothetical protein n=1 Tax=Klebsiella pneumoniae TaxID=573 RepID=UPI003EE19ED7
GSGNIGTNASNILTNATTLTASTGTNPANNAGSVFITDGSATGVTIQNSGALINQAGNTPAGANTATYSLTASNGGITLPFSNSLKANTII